MVEINQCVRRVIKIAYVGPPLGGKTANLVHLHRTASRSRREELTSVAGNGDRVLFCDLSLPWFPRLGGQELWLHLETAPGQTYQQATRRLVAQGSYGLVFVASSRPEWFGSNVEAYEELREFLEEEGRDLDAIPLAIQLNKRDVSDALPVDELLDALGRPQAPVFLATADQGQGVLESLLCVARLTHLRLAHELAIPLEPPARTGGWGRGWSGDRFDRPLRWKDLARVSPFLFPDTP